MSTAKRPIIVAEVAQAHDGSLGQAHAFVDAIADAGADVVKFQTHIAAAESTLDESFRVRFSRQDATRYAYWKRMEFTPAQWKGIADHARERNIGFMSTPFSIEAVDWLRDLGMHAWKIGSGDLGWKALLEAVLATGGPVYFSTGMSSWNEIDAATVLAKARGVEFSVLQCTSKYPTPFSEVGLNILNDLRERYACPVGLSDHSGTPFPCLAALARGAEIVEVHITVDRRMFGPDTVASLTVEELAMLVCARDAFAEMDKHPVDKSRFADGMRDQRALFGRSLAARLPIPAGTVLTADMLACKKPAGGIPADALTQMIGRRLKRDVTPDRILRWEDLDE